MKSPAWGPALLRGLGPIIAGFLLLAAWAEMTGQLHLGWMRVPIQGIYDDGGHAYEGPLGSARWSSIDGPSRAVVLELGVPLGPGNSVHDDIRKGGGGRYSFWGDNIYLSASDNSDPRRNGRPYEAWGPGPYSTPLRVALFVLALAALVVLLKATKQRFVVTAISLIAAAALVTAVIRWVGIPFEGRIDPASIAFDAGSGIGAAPLPFASSWLRPLADDERHPRRSDLELFENGSPLGPAHADAATLSRGHGAYSHMASGIDLTFTPSDGSDPRNNGRAYTYRTRLRTSLWNLINLALAGGLVLLWSLVKRMKMPSMEKRSQAALGGQSFLNVLAYLNMLGWICAGILTLWLVGSGLSPGVAAWAPLQIPGFGRAVLEADRLLPATLLLLAFLGHLLMPRATAEPRRLGPLALVPFIFALGYFCSIYRTDSLYGLDHDPNSNFLGYLPHSDAADYYEGARYLIDKGDLSGFAARRPANAAWLAIRLAAMGHLTEATLAQVVLVGIAAAYLGFVVWRLFGPWSSMAVVALVYAYSRLFFTTTLSEAAGISLGALGTALGLLGLRSEKRWVFLAGMCALGLAESFRAGALLAPLGFAAGGALLARPGRRLTTGLLAASVFIATLLISPLLNTVYGSGKGQTGGNLAWVAAGLSIGETWGVAQSRYASELDALSGETERTRFLYAKAYQNFREDPRPTFTAVGRSFTLFRWQTPEVLGGLTGAGSFGSVVLALLIGHRILRHLTIPSWILRIAGPFVVGFLLCLPIIYLDGGWRVIAASTPFIFTLLSVLVASPSAPPPEIGKPDRIAAWCPLAMIAALLILPGVVQRLTTSPDTSCAQPGIQVVRHPTDEPSVLYERSAESSRLGVPVISPRRMRAQLRYSGIDLVLPDPPVLLEWAYDYASGRLYTLVGPSEMLDTRSEFIWVKTLPLGPPWTHVRVERFGAWNGCGPGQTGGRANP